MNPDKSCEIDQVKQKGVIHDIDDRFFYVTVESVSACASCHARGMCHIAEISEKIIEIPRTSGGDYRKGQKVEVFMKRSLGLQAVFLGYFLPFLVLIAALILLLNFIPEQGTAALISLGILALYYVILYRVRDRLKRKFIFKLS